MRLAIVVRPQAQAEIQTAYDWYEGASAGLGERFLLEVDSIFGRVSENPKSFPTAFGFRRAVISKFPYCAYFRESSSQVVIVAMYHGRRDPAVLRQRS